MDAMQSSGNLLSAPQSLEPESTGARAPQGPKALPAAEAQPQPDAPALGSQPRLQLAQPAQVVVQLAPGSERALAQLQQERQAVEDNKAAPKDDLEALRDAAWLAGGDTKAAQQAVQAAWVSWGAGSSLEGCGRRARSLLRLPGPSQTLAVPPPARHRPMPVPRWPAARPACWRRCPACGCCPLAPKRSHSRQARC